MSQNKYFEERQLDKLYTAISQEIVKWGIGFTAIPVINICKNIVREFDLSRRAFVPGDCKQSPIEIALINLAEMNTKEETNDE